MSTALTTFLFEMANFVLLAGVLGWVLFKPVRRALETRRATQAAQMEQAQMKLAEAERLRSDIEQQRAALDGELQRLREQTRAAAEREAETIRAQARDTVQREYEAGKRRLSHLEQAQIERLSRLLAATAREVVSRLLEQLDTPELEDALTKVACQQLRALTGDALAPVIVESAKPLTADRRSAIADALGNAVETAVFRVVPALGAGLRISTSRGLIDASSAGLAAFAERHLTDRLASEGNGELPHA